MYIGLPAVWLEAASIKMGELPILPFGRKKEERRMGGRESPGVPNEIESGRR